MYLTILQAVLTAAACYGLWRFARRMPLIVVAGFLVRAFAGQALFWISWLRLPIARSLQLGDGFWFFAIDGPGYIQFANEVIAKGPVASLLAGAIYPSHVFVYVFALFVAAFGAVASTAILFNCAAYLAMCALVIRMAPAHRFTLLALSFGPAAILWSLQPLKDTFFMLLIVALVYAAKRWQEQRSLVLAGAAMLVVLYAISGTRWYFAVIVWGISAIFFLMSAIPSRRWWPALIVFVLLGQALRIGGDTDLPIPLRNVLEAHLESVPVTHYVAATRKGFETTPGATTIRPGSAIAATPPQATTPQATTQAAAPEAVPSPARVVTAGTAAVFVPRAAAQELHLVRIGGGRGFWLFADFDTIIFSGVILFAVVACIRALRRGARITPLFVLIVLVFVATAGPMIYSVNNFGTLFRLRQMLYVLAALAPLALGMRGGAVAR